MNSCLRFVSCLSVLLAGLLLLTGVVLLPSPPASAATGIDDGVIELGTVPMQLVPDVANNRVWVRGEDRVEVADIAQGTARGVEVAAARDLALNADGSKAYVTTGSSIVEIDAGSLATRTFDLGSGHCSSDVAAGAVMVHYGDFCRSPGVLDPRTGDQVDLPEYGSPISVPGRDRVLYWAGHQLTVVDGTSSTVLAQRELPFLEFREPQVSSDGTRVFAFQSTGSPVHVRDLDSLGPVGSLPYGAPEYSESSLDLLDDLVLIPRGGTSVYDLETGAMVNHLLPDSPERWGLSTVTALGNVVVSGGGSQSGEGALFIEADPRAAAPDLTLDRPFPPDGFTPVSLEGTLNDQGAPMAGETVVVTDSRGGPIATATTDADGHYTTEEVRFPTGTNLVARWSGGTARPSAVTYQTVSVPPTDTQLSISAPGQVSPTDSVPLTVHLRSAAGDDVDGMTVDLYRRCDGTGGWATVASVVTGSDGTATHTDSAAPCLEVEYLARHEFTQTTHTSAVVTSVTVTWRSSALELTTPDNVMAGDTATVRARLLIDGQPAAGRTVTLRSGDAEARDLVTDDAGLVSAEVAFPTGGSQRVRWDFAGDDLVLPSWADTYVLVPRRGTTLSADPAPTSSPVTEPFTVAGTLTDERGEPVPDAELYLQHSGSEVLTHTASDGTYTAEIQPGRWDPAYPVRLTFEGDAAHEATGAETVVDVQPVESSLTLSADAPRVAAGEEVALRGTLTTALGEDLTGQVVHLARVDPDGTITALPGVELDAAGDFSFTDTPRSEGDVRYVATRDRDDWYRAVRAEKSVEVVTRAPLQLTMTTDRNRYGTGETATVRLDADGSTGVEVLLTAEQSDGTVWTVYQGSLPADGLTSEVVVTHTTTFVAEVAQTVDHEAASARLTREVRLGVTTTVPNAWGSTAGSLLVSPRAEPRILTKVGPDRSDVCLRYDVQRRVDGRWTSRGTSECRWTDERGRATYRMSAKPLGSRWRVRPIFAGDELNAATTGAWVGLQIRRQS